MLLERRSISRRICFYQLMKGEGLATAVVCRTTTCTDSIAQYRCVDGGLSFVDRCILLHDGPNIELGKPLVVHEEKVWEIFGLK